MIAIGDAPGGTLFVRPLAELTAADPAIVGSKAATLARLRAAGFPVPDGFVVGGVSVSGLRMPSVREAIAVGLKGLGGGRVAVRSSAAAEDLAGASFAGQYESVLGVEGVHEVLDAAERVMHSAESDRVARYVERTKSAPAASGVAVLVQRMVAADAAGVAFTADPVTGDRERVVINAVRGLGDRLVSGEAEPDEWVVVDGGSPERRRWVDDVIDAALASQIADLARRIEAHEGGPLDVEWAAVGPTVYVLQSRPMTGLPAAVSWESPLPGGWSRDFRLGEWLGDPVTPLFESWLLTRLESQLHRNYAQILGTAMPEPAHVVVNGWYFYGVNFLPTRPLAMLAMMVRVLPRLILRPRRTAMAFPPLAKIGIGLAEREWRTQERPRYRRSVADAAGEVESAAPARLVSMIDALADAAGDYFTALTKVAGYASKAQLPLARLYATHLEPRIGGSHLDLLVGLGEEPPVPASHAVRTLDWWEPTLGETAPAPNLERTRARHAAARSRRLDAESRARVALGADRKLLQRFEWVLADAQRYAVVREDLVAELTLPWPTLRRAVARLGEALTHKGVLEQPEQVWFVTYDEIAGAVAGMSKPLASKANDRLHTWGQQRRLVPPLRLGVLPPMMQRILDAAEGAVRGSATGSTDDIVGVPASPGRASGPVRVVRSADDFDRVQTGDVLVAPITAPAWTPLFGRVTAIVTDTGSVAAHASIVAREYGLPAVVGTADSTARLRDGDLVEVDGSAGLVRRLPVAGPGAVAELPDNR
jgi:pyruvate,water dikinase